jgi:LDH2 family malate/lactate/ureidoglycolate dehydrogenase
MKIGHWIAAAATLYLAYAGVQEIASTNGIALPAVPDASSVTGGTGYTAALVDLGLAGVLYFTVLHKRLMA